MNTTLPDSTDAAKEWDRIRAAFASSVMINTPLASLAQALDGAVWPIASAAETPAAYIDFDYDELLGEFAARRLPKFAPMLINILQETLAFDEPCGDMIAQTAAAVERDNPFRRALARLGIPADYPLELVTLDEASRELCRLEQLATLGQFAVFAQGLSQSIIVGGDLRRLLNALAQTDEETLAEFVPFRTGSSGLHLPEALALAALSAHPPAQIARTLGWFSAECADWRVAAGADGDFIAHQLRVLDQPPLEERILQLLKPHIRSAPPKRQPQWWTSFARWRKA